MTLAAGIVESFISQLIWSALKIAVLQNTVTCKAKVEYDSYHGAYSLERQKYAAAAESAASAEVLTLFM